MSTIVDGRLFYSVEIIVCDCYEFIKDNAYINNKCFRIVKISNVRSPLVSKTLNQCDAASVVSNALILNLHRLETLSTT